MNPSIDAPVIYPIDSGKEMILISKKEVAKFIRQTDRFSWMVF